MTFAYRAALATTAIVVALTASCSSNAPPDVASTPSPSLNPRDAAKAEYIKVLKDQNVRYRSESDAYEMADEVCKDLESTAISKTQSGREQWAHSMLVLHRDLSDRDATTLITATQNSKMCSVK